MRRLAIISVLAMLAGAFMACGKTEAATSADFFKGKTITVYIGYGPGGGYDTYARLIANHFGRHIDGGPVLVAKNMPGAGSIKLANQLYAVLPKDGTAVGMIGDVLALKQVLGEKSIQFKAREFNWIGRIANTNPVLIVWHTAPVKTFENAKQIPIVIGVPGAGSATTLNLTAINSILGTRFRLISGYGGSTEVKLALERGEVQGSGSVLWELLKTQHKDWLDQKKIRILYQVGVARQPDLPDVPTTVELGRNDDEKRLLRLFSSYTVVGRSLLAPPEVPRDRVAALRAAFDTLARDPELLAEAGRLNLSVGYMSGARMQEFIEDISNLPGPLLQKAREAGNIKVEKRKKKDK